MQTIFQPLKQTNLSICAHISTYFHSGGQNMMKNQQKTTRQILCALLYILVTITEEPVY